MGFLIVEKDIMLLRLLSVLVLVLLLLLTSSSSATSQGSQQVSIEQGWDEPEIYYVNVPPPPPFLLMEDEDDEDEIDSRMMSSAGRDLQIATGTGVSGDICSAGGGRFSCQVGTALNSTDGNTTRLDMTFSCILDSFLGYDWRRSEDCRCQAHVSQVNKTTRLCACLGCPMDFQSPIAFDCSNNQEDPFLIGTCVSLDCNGACNGSIAMVNVPTPAPGTTVVIGPDGKPQTIPPETQQDDSSTNAALRVGMLVVSMSVASALWMILSS